MCVALYPMGYDALRSEAAAFLRLVFLEGKIEFFGDLAESPAFVFYNLD
jgi:hypothetical protein